MPTTTTQHTHPRITGLDGQTREWDEVFASAPLGLQHCHGLSRLAEHVVRQTFFDRAVPHADRASFPATGDGYQDALTAARWLRLHTEGGYAVIDRVYSCGCRTNG